MTQRLVFLVVALVAVAATFTSKAAIADVEVKYYPGVDLEIGHGVKPDFRAAPSDCYIKHTEPDEGGIVQDILVSLVVSSRGLKQALGIDTSVDVSVPLTGSATSQFDFDSLKTVHQNSATLVINVQRSYPNVHVAGDTKLYREFQELVTSGDFKGFYEKCGTGFVENVQKGASIAAIVTFDNLSLDDSQEIRASLSAGADFGPVSGDVKVRLHNEVANTSNHVSVTVQVHQVGGDGATTDEVVKAAVKSALSSGSSMDDAISGITDALGNVVRGFNPENARIVSYSVKDSPIAAVPRFDGGGADKQALLSIMVEQYRLAFAVDNEIKLMFLDGAPAGSGISREMLVAAQQEESQVALELSKLAQAQSDCISASRENMNATCKWQIVTFPQSFQTILDLLANREFAMRACTNANMNVWDWIQGSDLDDIRYSYCRVLQYPADPQGEQDYLYTLHVLHQTRTDLLIDMMRSPAFRGGHQLINIGRDDFNRLAFRLLLRYEPNAGQLRDWGWWYDQYYCCHGQSDDLTREQVFRAIATSCESYHANSVWFRGSGLAPCHPSANSDPCHHY